MSRQGKYYVVWEGREPGIYPSWEECRDQVEGFAGARYKSFDTKEEAVAAYRGKVSDHMDLLRAIASHKNEKVNYAAFPEIRLDAIAVDGACSKNPGPIEYKGVKVGTGETIFQVGPLEGGTNNVAEYLALVHALALLDKQGDRTTPVYADSRTSLAWLRNKGHKSAVVTSSTTSPIAQLLRRADNWVQTHQPIYNPVLKWDTEKWGEIPADFGRK